jgi:glycosyltransferase involved in cell wall biosynthesis
MESNNTPLLGIIVPCFNEEKILPVTAKKLQEKVLALASQGLIENSSQVYFIDDGSTDNSWKIIKQLVADNDCFSGIKLTRNFGHQYALYGGLMEAKGDVLISLDADMQDDIDVIDNMIAEFKKGNEVVYGVRNDRNTDGFLKRWSAETHYRATALMGIETVHNHADYRLLSRKAVNLLSQFRETNLYLRGIVPLLGLQSSQVYYKRQLRSAGESKYKFKNMFSLSVKGITSFSIMPLRIITAMGLLVFTVSVVMGCWALHAALQGDKAVAGWASTVIPIYLFGGLQLLAVGVAGEYVGKTYMEVKQRPLYLVDQVCDSEVSKDIDNIEKRIGGPG